MTISAPPPRPAEDDRLLRGQGKYTADDDRPGQLHGAFLRSPVSHAEIRSIDVSEALNRPDVVAVLTGDDMCAYAVAPHASGQNNADGSPMVVPDWPPLAIDRVRFIGEPIALVVARTREAALDGLDALTVDLKHLSSVAATREEPALALWPHAPDNVALDFRAGDEAAVARAFAAAAHVTRVRVVNQRVLVGAMEPRAAVASFDPATGRFDLVAGSQGAPALARQIAQKLGIDPDRVRVVSRDVGGGFGAKSHVYPEYVALLVASRRLNAPIKWVSSRSEAFLSDTQGRDTLLDGALALDADGRFLGVRVDSIINVGAYQASHQTITATGNLFRCLASVYATPAVAVTAKCVYSNTVPMGPYRGAGRPEANLIMERLVDRAAAETGVAPGELRRRNLVPRSAMPYRAPNGLVYDSGDFPLILERALALADWDGFSFRRREAARRGRIRGIGIGCYLEIAGGAPFEDMRLDIEADGTVRIASGLQSNGQGHASVFPRIVADALGLASTTVRLADGDSTLMPDGNGSVGSRSLTVGGAAALAVSAALIDAATAAGAALLQARPDDVVYEAGVIRIAGSDQAVTLASIVAAGHPLSVTARGHAPLTYPNGCHVAEIEIDPATGEAAFVAVTAVDDVGRCFDPALVEGQVRGGVAQGLGQVLLERLVYDDQGQLVTGSFADYPLPRADDLPPVQVEHVEVQCTTNPLGAKGAGEAGTTGSLAAGYNALMNALGSVGIDTFDMPATPDRLWSVLRHASCAWSKPARPGPTRRGAVPRKSNRDSIIPVHEDVR